ncbi:MAG: hypothetical protein WAN46_09625 [Gammaproteobacteria bacterium]
MDLKRGAPGVALGVVLMGATVCTGAATPTEKAIAQARQELRISEAMAQRIQARLSEVRQLPHVSPAELADLERYWQRLEQVVREHRVAVARLEAQGPIHPRSEGGEQGVKPSSRAVFVIVPEKTEADEIAALDAELNSSLSRFDEMLLKEMDGLRRSAGSSSVREADGALADTPATATESAGQSAGKPGEMAAQRGETDESGEQRPVNGEQGLPRQPGGESEPKAGTASARPPIPPDIPDGSDDDLVARQIREAAMNEPDPALREKLWEEYRKYKRGAG